jgi:hypothetical protein
MAFNGFRGNIGTAGAVQTTYTDQPGVGVPGMIAYPADYNNVDSYLINETEGIACGKGVTLIIPTDASASSVSHLLQTPNLVAQLPTAATDTLAEFGGILVFDETAQSDANGVPGYNDGRIGRVLRPGRSGGRIFVAVNDLDTIVPGTSSVNLVTVAGSDGKYKVGDFAPAALAGTAEAGTSLAITTASWVTPDFANGSHKVAMIELG